MKPSDVYEFFGTQAKAAAALGMKQPAVCEWQKRGIPRARQYQIFVVTGGALKPDDMQDESAPALSAEQQS